ncbi:glucose-1-phosphate cytidylyltransferase [Halochromatium glycolicum]|uniref:Glucose-1-phosphate cytidylyltransferase n=1 Tax=Halochromatium glycolicum TaxID=85075 RepID=A0AAJ0X7J4_9GAMM|nr:glucose-1-phosphate cytidylyltransferase [Halochromatium glycolicum]MBK1703174.1 glucose-1-phosphate cytidylyltransferase [Halochromatium glycolicum]
MKAVILAGGYGTRLSEETSNRPKPMVEIGGRPILWHILKIYSAHGINDFVICLGYKGYMIKEFFANYMLHMSDVHIDLSRHETHILEKGAEPWRLTLIDTGESTMTGGRLKRVAPYLDNETFCLTYGDGLGNVDIRASIAAHRSQGVLATVTAVRPPGRFGALEIDNSGAVQRFHEKPGGDGSMINGGFFVLEPGVFDYIEDDQTVWERDPLERLTRNGELGSYRHEGFWQPMDTLRDKLALEQAWASGRAPWKVW